MENKPYTKNNNISFEEFGKIILKAIEDEPYLNKQELITKVKALGLAFKLNLNAVKYKSIENPTAYQVQLRNNEQKQFENKFWRDVIKEKNGNDFLMQKCQELDKLLIEFGFKN